MIGVECDFVRALWCLVQFSLALLCQLLLRVLPEQAAHVFGAADFMLRSQNAQDSISLFVNGADMVVGCFHGIYDSTDTYG